MHFCHSNSNQTKNWMKVNWKLWIKEQNSLEKCLVIMIWDFFLNILSTLIKLLLVRPHNNVIRATNLGGNTTRIVQVKITKIVAVITLFKVTLVSIRPLFLWFWVGGSKSAYKRQFLATTYLRRFLELLWYGTICQNVSKCLVKIYN